jgi:hypothetical protein
VREKSTQIHNGHVPSAVSVDDSGDEEDRMAAGRRRAAWCVIAVSVLAAGCGPIAKATAAGTVPPRPGKPLWLRSLQMTSADDGWAMSEAENPANPSVSPSLLLTRTSDGGQTWADVMPAGARPMLATSSASEVLDAVDGERAYFAVTASSAMGRNPVQVYRTSDGGRHWSLAASSPPFGSDAHAGIPVACDKTAITFPAVTAGWLTSDCNATSSDALLVSKDGGGTWAAQPLPVPLGVNGYSAVLSGPEFVNGTGFLTVGQYGGTPALLATSDLGRTWRRLPLPSGAGSYPQVKFFSRADGQAWQAVRQGVHFTQSGVSVDFVSQRAGVAWIAGGDTQAAPDSQAVRDLLTR